jgi:hypothetical protein
VTADSFIAPRLPVRLDSEQAVLGLVFRQDSLYAEARAVVSPEDFFDRRHRQAFATMQMLAEQNKPPDILLVIDALEGQIDAEGIAYLSEIAACGPHANNIEHYAEIVRKKAFERKIITTIAELAARAESLREHPESVLADALAQLSAINSDAGSGSDWRNKFHLQSELSNEPTVPLIEGFLPETGITTLASLSGTGKTFLGISATKALTTGEPFLGQFPVNGLHNVFYLVPEMAEKTFNRRLNKFSIPNDRLRVQTMSDPLCSLADPDLFRALKEMKPILILDTAIRFSKSKNEDSASETGAFANQLFDLLRGGAKHIIALHHTPKSADALDRMTLESMLRGSGDFGAFSECVWGLRHARNPNSKTRDLAYDDESEKLTRLDVQNLMPRDLEPVADPFVIQGRPYINEQGDFVVFRTDLEGGANESSRIAQALSADPRLSKRQLEVQTLIGRNRIEAVAATVGWFYEEASPGKRGKWVKK